MAEIELQRKEQQSLWWMWLIAALLLIGLIWWWMSNNQRAAEVPGIGSTATGETGTLAPGAAQPNLPLAAIAANPDNYFGNEISGMATISEVMSPQAFRIEQDGNTMFAYWADAPTAENMGPTVGQQISLTGTVRDPKNMQEYVDTNLVAEATLRDLQNAGAFLVVTNGELQNKESDGGIVGEAGEAVENAGEAVTPGR